MRTIRTFLLVLATVFAGWQSPAIAQAVMSAATGKAPQTSPAGRIAWHHVGRVFLNPSTGQFVYVGYLVQIDPINSSLFNGPAGENTAYFTFSTDVAHPTQLNAAAQQQRRRPGPCVGWYVQRLLQRDSRR